MKKIAALIVALVFSLTAVAQDGFAFDQPGKKKISIPFKLINNLMIVSATVNGAPMNFLLDTGVDETILFSLEEQGDVELHNVQKIKLKGLGTNEAIEGLKSSHNVMAFKGYRDRDHDIYIVLDQSFNFSASIGIPVNGILGYHFFKNHLVEIDYDNHRVIVYSNENDKIRKKIEKDLFATPISVEENKPYLTGLIALDSQSEFDGKLLVDTGNTDALWLFRDKSDKIVLPEKKFDDFLGRGLSGDIMGQRARIEKFRLGNSEFKNAIVSFPDQNSLQHITMVKDRVGSVGSEILRRFRIVFDYRGGQMYLRRSSHFDQPFTYNMSGLEIHHEGMTWVQQEISERSSKVSAAQHEIELMPGALSYRFELKPIFSIANVRKDSPAEACGLKKGDILLRINGRQCYRLSLQEINAMLKSEEGKIVELEIERMGKPIKFSFKLKSII